MILTEIVSPSSGAARVDGGVRDPARLLAARGADGLHLEPRDAGDGLRRQGHAVAHRRQAGPAHQRVAARLQVRGRCGEGWGGAGGAGMRGVG